MENTENIHKLLEEINSKYPSTTPRCEVSLGYLGWLLENSEIAVQNNLEYYQKLSVENEGITHSKLQLEEIRNLLNLL